MGDDVTATDQPPEDRPGLLARARWWHWALLAVVVAVAAAAVPLLRTLDEVERVAVDTDSARERLASGSSEDDAGGPGEAGTGSAASDESGDGSTPGSDDPTEPVDGSTPGSDDPAEPVDGADATDGSTAGPDGDGDQSATDASGLGQDLPPLDLPATLAADGAFRSFLVVGSDARAGLGGSRADVLLVGLLPAGGNDPILFSLPRDLWLPDPCHGGSQRINAAANGCGDRANAFELTSIVVEDFTGIGIDHVVGIDFEGFKDVIDAVGGVSICVDNAVRDGALSLPAGCTLAGGDQALGWVRSRKTEELVDGQWQRMAGVSDLTRNQRQQELVVQLLSRVGSFGTVRNLYSLADGVRDSVTLGSGLSVVDGTRLAWGLRGRSGDIRRFSIPVSDMVTSGGAQVLVPTESFATTFEREVGVDLAALGAEG